MDRTIPMTGRRLLVLLSLLVAMAASAVSPATVEMLEALRSLAADDFSEERGRETWLLEVDERSCTSCHTDSLTSRGRHQKTGKVIEPMAPSVNPERLTSRKKIDKWFLRNCKWTFGRECTAQEKGDILLWLSTQ